VTAVCLVLAGCDNLQEPATSQNAEMQVAGPAQQPFYYYQGQPVDLSVDPTRIVVASTAPEAQAMIADAIHGAGLGVAKIARMIQASGHYVVQLSPGPSAAAVTQAVRGLRQTGRFDFVSNVYKTV